MAKMQIVSIYDSAAEAFSRPVFTASKGVAVRSFAQEVNDPANKDLHQHTEQFQMFDLGTWDDETGKFEQPAQPVLITAAISLKR